MKIAIIALAVYTFIGLGRSQTYDFNLLAVECVDKVLVTETDGVIPNSCCASAAIVLRDGSILAVGLDNSLYRKPYLYDESSFEKIPNSCCVTDITQMPDGTIVGINTDGKLVTSDPDISSEWSVIPRSRGAVRIEATPDGSLVGVSASGSLKVRSSVDGDWAFMRSAGLSVKDIGVQPNGIILGVSEDGTTLHALSESGDWGPQLLDGCVTSFYAYGNFVVAPEATEPPVHVATEPPVETFCESEGKFARACKDQQVTLTCPGGGVHIESANYGRTEWAVCGLFFVNDCIASNSVEIIQGMCEGQESCTVTASDSVFGDPCPYIDKYVDINYTCRFSTEIATENFNRACKNQETTLICPGGHIAIKSANYGRTEWAVCGLFFVNDCVASNSVEIIQGMCDGQESCTVTASDSVFGDPCPYIDKYLDITWDCMTC